MRHPDVTIVDIEEEYRVVEFDEKCWCSYGTWSSDFGI